jgi:hypothetical protein
MDNQLVKIENRAGHPIQAGEIQIIPITQSIKAQPPGFWGLLLWNRPTAVVVRTADGQEKVLPVQDITRYTQLILMGIGVLGSLLIWLALRKNRA